MGLRFTNIYEITEIIHILMYFPARIFGFTPVVFNAVYWPNIPLFAKIGAVLVLLYSYYTLNQMLKVLKMRYRHQKLRNAKGLSYYWFSMNPSLKKLDYVSKPQSIFMPNRST